MAEKKETAQKPKKASTKATAKAGSTKASKEEKKPAKKVTKKPTMAQKKKVNALVIALSDASRRTRQDASHELAELAHVAPLAFEEHIDSLIDALYRPEAQTRWEVLDALANLSEHFGDQVFRHLMPLRLLCLIMTQQLYV